jgi:hypothetical protein
VLQDNDQVEIVAENYGTDVPLPPLTKVVEFWGISGRPIIDVIETDRRGYTRYIEQGRKVSGKREARQIAKDLGAEWYC